jgi:hypothetical protein
MGGSDAKRVVGVLWMEGEPCWVVLRTNRALRVRDGWKEEEKRHVRIRGWRPKSGGDRKYCRNTVEEEGSANPRMPVGGDVLMSASVFGVRAPPASASERLLNFIPRPMSRALMLVKE